MEEELLSSDIVRCWGVGVASGGIQFDACSMASSKERSETKDDSEGVCLGVSSMPPPVVGWGIGSFVCDGTEKNSVIGVETVFVEVERDR